MSKKQNGAGLCLLCCMGIVGVGLFSLPTAAVYFGSTTYWFYIVLGGALATVLTLLFSMSLDGTVYETCTAGWPRFGKAICFVYLLFYTAVSAFLLAYYTHTVQRWFLDGVPHFFLTVFLSTVCLYTASKPQREMAQLCWFIGIFVLCAVVIMRLVMLLSGDVRNLMPVFETAQLQNLPNGAVFVAGFFVLLGFLGVWRASKKVRAGAGCAAIWIAILLFLLATAGCVSVLGPLQTARHLDSSVLAMKNLNLSKLDFLQRGDIVFIVTWSFLVLLTGTLSCHIPYCTANELFAGVKRRWLFFIFLPVFAGVSILIKSEETALLCLVYTAVGGGAAALILLPLWLLWKKGRMKR